MRRKMEQENKVKKENEVNLRRTRCPHYTLRIIVLNPLESNELGAFVIVKPFEADG